MRILWLGFWSAMIGRGESNNRSLVAQGAIEAQRQQLGRVRTAMTDLIFQKKKMQDRLEAADREVVELKIDVQQAASEDRDELAVNLMTRLDTTQEEHTFLKAQVETLTRDVEIARETEQKLVKDITNAEQMIGALTSRYEALRLQRKIQVDLQDVSRAMSTVASATLSPLGEQVKRMEAELEAFQVRREGWEKDWQAMRQGRVSSRHRDALADLKRNLKQRHTLPAIIVAASPSV